MSDYVSAFTQQERQDVSTYRRDGATHEQAVIRVFQARTPVKVKCPTIEQLDDLAKRRLVNAMAYKS